MSKTSFKANEDTRIWCEYCRIFVFNNRINREKHDNSPQHQANFKKNVETLRREELEKKKILGNLTVDLKSASSSRSFYQNGKEISPNPASHAHSTSEGQSLGNMLNLKRKPLQEESVSSRDRKMIPGLTTTKKPLQSISAPSSIKPTRDSRGEIQLLRHIPISDSDLKSTSSDLKRKIFEDEKKLLSASGVYSNVPYSALEQKKDIETEQKEELDLETEQEQEKDILTLFKKKKTNPNS